MAGEIQGVYQTYDALSGILSPLNGAGLVAAAVIVILIGVINCFFGYRLFKIMWTVMCVLVIAFITVIATLATAKAYVALIGLAACVLAALFAVRLYFVASFFRGFGIGLLVGVVIGLVGKMEFNVCLFIGLAAAILFGVLSLLLRKVFLIAETSISGGLEIGMALTSVIGCRSLMTLISVPFTVAGFIVQWKYHKNKEAEGVKMAENAAPADALPEAADSANK